MAMKLVPLITVVGCHFVPVQAAFLVMGGQNASPIGHVVSPRLGPEPEATPRTTE